MRKQFPFFRRSTESPALPLSVRMRNQIIQARECIKGSPLPPTTMMYLVQGNDDAYFYVEYGRRGFESVRDTLDKTYVDVKSFHRILDFGCGPGRVLRYWKPFARNIDLHGVDYNLELVLWARRAMPFAHIERNNLEPPLSYKDNTFDFIYALSTFTHWTVDLQNAWMREFTRVLRPGGYLLFTVHGDYYVERLVPELREHYLAGRAVTGLEHVGTNLCSAYNPPSQVQSELLQDMKLVGFYPRSALGNPWQDVYLAQKPTDS